MFFREKYIFISTEDTHKFSGELQNDFQREIYDLLFSRQLGT